MGHVGWCPLGGASKIPCEGKYVPGEGLCMRHAMLFDIWIAEHGGHRVYSFVPAGAEIPNATQGRMNPESLREWKRLQFRAWLNTGEARVALSRIQVEHSSAGSPEGTK